MVKEDNNALQLVSHSLSPLKGTYSQRQIGAITEMYSLEAASSMWMNALVHKIQGISNSPTVLRQGVYAIIRDQIAFD
jgi:hypothetical protein